MVTKIYLVRHGKTNIPEAAQKPEDPLSDLGKRQVAATAKRLFGLTKIDVIYSSNLQRAIESASIIGDIVGCTDHKQDGRLNEIGLWISPINLHESISSIDQYEHALHEIEKLQEHALSFLEQISGEHAGKNVLVVSHGNMLRAIIAKAMDASLETAVRLRIDNASLSLLEYDTDGYMPFFRLSLFNETEAVY